LVLLRKKIGSAL